MNSESSRHTGEYGILSEQSWLIGQGELEVPVGGVVQLEPLVGVLGRRHDLHKGGLAGHRPVKERTVVLPDAG